MAQVSKRNRKNASGLKMAITVASVAVTLGGWAEFSSQDVNLAQADQQQQVPALNQGVINTDGTNGTGDNTTITPSRGRFGNRQVGGYGQPSNSTGSNSDLNGQSQSTNLPAPITRSRSSR